MNCQVCGRRRLRRKLYPLKAPVTFVVNYQTGERRTFPVGTLICDTEWRKLNTVGGGSTSDDQAIACYGGTWRRTDGAVVL